MKEYIDGINFHELDNMKYYSTPASWSQEKKKDLTRNRIFSGEFWGSEKKDGFFSKFVKDEDGNMFLLSRSRNTSGEYPNKIEWCPQLNDFFSYLPNGTCILGELYLPSKPGSRNVSTILGCLKEKALDRQEKGEKIHFYCFDVLAYGGVSYIDEPFLKRIELLRPLSSLSTDENIEFAQYVNGEDLWNLLQNVLADDGEGIVITHMDAHYEPGKRPSKTTLKCKKEIQETVDCVILGANPPSKTYTGKEIKTWKYWINTITNEATLDLTYDEIEECTNSYKKWKNGESVEPVTKNYFFKMAGSLKIGLYKDGTLIHFGDLSGITEEILTNWKDYVGKVIEVGGMEFNKDSMGAVTAIRHPKFLGFRDDKNPEDCTWDQLSI